MQRGMSTHGAVDLAALAAQREAQEKAQARAEQARATAAEAAAAGVDGAPAVPVGPAVVDVTEDTFQAEVVDRSAFVPVVIDFWASWCGPCKQLSPVLERLAEEADGRWVLAKVDVDANPQLAAGFQVQSIPTVHVVWQGQLIPGFMGALPEAQVRQFVDELLRVTADGGEGLAPPDEPELDEAADAIERGDLDAAAAAYQRLLDRKPADADARAGLRSVELMRRLRGVDPQRALAAAATRPENLEAVRTAADVEFARGDAAAAFDRLIAAVRTASGTDRDALRGHLVDLFELLPADDPRLVKARTDLASALF